MFFYIVLTPISTTSGLRSTGNTRKYHQIDVYIYQCVSVQLISIFIKQVLAFQKILASFSTSVLLSNM